MAEYVDFHYLPLEGKISGMSMLKQTEDAINDLGQKVYSIEVDADDIQQALDNSEQAIDTANTALATVTTNRAVWFNNVADMVAADLDVGVVAATKGYYLPNDGGNGFYIIRTRVSGDTDDGGSIIFLDNGVTAELIVDGSVDVKQFGAKGDGATDDTVAIQKACDYAFSIEDTGKSSNQKGKIFLVTAGTGNYLVTNTITIKSSCDLSQMNIWADGTVVSPVVAVGSTSGVSTYSKTLKLPNVYNYQNGDLTNTWDNTGIGMELRNVQNCNIYIPQLTGFTTGLVINPTGQGNTNNNYFLQALTYCKVCMLVTATSGGWPYENIFYGGRFTPSSDSNGSWVGTREIVFERGNNLLFLKPNLETTNGEYAIEFIDCRYTSFVNARYEGAGAKRMAVNSSNSGDVSKLYFLGGYQVEYLNFIKIGSYDATNTIVLSSAESFFGSVTATYNGGADGFSVKDFSTPQNYYARLTHVLRLKRTPTNTNDMIYLGSNSVGTGLFFPAELSDGGNDFAGGIWLRTISTTSIAVNKHFITLDSTKNLGSATYRWGTLYATNGTIDTSDEREKQDIEPIPDAVFRAWSKVNFVQFRFKDAVAKKGDGARIHCGLIAQQVKEAFESEGLDAFRYGLLCYDEWEDEYEDIELEDGTIEHRKITEAGNRYGIRYEEALALECAYQRWLASKK